MSLSPEEKLQRKLIIGEWVMIAGHIEKMLKMDFGSKEKGLRKLALQANLPPELFDMINSLAGYRNKLVHNVDWQLKSRHRERFQELSDKIFAELSRLLSEKEQQQQWDREDTQRYEARLLRWKQDAEMRLRLKQKIDTRLATISLSAATSTRPGSGEANSTSDKTAKVSKYVAIVAAAGAGIVAAVGMFAMQKRK
ncbi:hypothetical protein EIC82_03745 [Enterobacter sp. A11]|uniref:hypothetical protein n=1 Tax=unclassified Enterobacter TaxID=2608935 RepID=UPI00106FDFC2|nr:MULTISPECIES: hypothetical protein [unclassified Enterobacter]MBM1020240.1 hypothetical protein [Enterobacter sp. E1]MEA3561541.1 hypothetical protein [Enterobacter sp. GM-22]MEA3595163.1 hypothetical protein [Enterobacter sp. GM-31]TFF60302.1 hypothetical protein EIC82_03745 [Enterobacter sp. A11]